MRLKLIVHLVRRETLERDYERIPYEPLTQDVLGIPVLKVVIQVVAGRNIAVLVEAAVRNTILQIARHRHLPGVCRAPPQGDGPSLGH
jgi:HPr kinase/phosphorylase